MKGAADMANQEQQEQGPQPGDRTFTQFLHEQRKGGLHAELTEKLAEVVKAASDTGKAGTLTLKISAKPTEDGLTIVISDDVVAKVPEPDKGASLYFTDDAGNLHRSDPRQTALPLHNLKEADANAG